MNGLFNSTVLDVAIGLVFVYLLLAIIASAVNEWLTRLLKTRAKMLEQGIKQLLDAQPAKAVDGAASGDNKPNGSFVDLFYKHPIMSGMCHDHQNPSYLPARAFAQILMDLVTHDKEGAITFDDLENGIKALPPGDVRKALLTLIQNCSRNLEVAQTAIEAWFDDSMDRVSGWFKRRTQVVILAIAVGITIFTNADTLHIARQLSADPVLRNAIVDQAKTDSQKPRPKVSVEYPDETDPTKAEVTNLGSSPISDEDKQLLGQVLGWQSVTKNDSFWKWLERVLGWLLTAFAVSLGAPFWFDLLNKFMNLRSAGKSPTEKPKSSEKTKRPPANTTA